MKPVSAICTSVYSESHPKKHYVRFQVTFAESNQNGSLTIETDKHHRYAIASELTLFGNGAINKGYQPWEVNSWQDALLNAWLRYINVTGYCAATSQDMVFELQHQDNSYCYELTAESKKLARSMYTRGTMINEDGTESHIVLIPQENPDLFTQSASYSEKANCSEEDESSTSTDKTNKYEFLNTSFSNIDFQIISGFMFAAGALAIAVAFTVLNAASCGVAGLVVGGLGVAAVLTGIGLFKTGYERNCKEQEPEQLYENVSAC
jgi:kynureninase